MLGHCIGYRHLLLNGHCLDMFMMMMMIVTQMQATLLDSLALLFGWGSIGSIGSLRIDGSAMGHCHAHGETRKDEL